MRGKKVKRLRKLLGVKHPGRRHGGTIGASKHVPEAVTWVGDIGVQEKEETNHG